MVALVDISSTIVMRKDVQNQPSALNIVTRLRGYITRIWSQGWSRLEYSSLMICPPASPQQPEFEAGKRRAHQLWLPHHSKILQHGKDLK
jgi:hypothetical protein